MLGRLFERLQQRVERLLSEHMHLVDDVDFQARLRRCIAHVVAQLADIINAAVACAVDFDHVEAVAPCNLTAIVAFAARRNRRAFNAIERFRQDPRG